MIRTPGPKAPRPSRRRARTILDRLMAAHPDARCALDYETPFQLAVATVLSAQCTDERVNMVTSGLFRTVREAEDLLVLGPERLEQAIRGVGLFRAKTKALIETSHRIVREHGGRLPSDREALEALPGIGPKTASVVLSNAFGVPALAVDTHVFRVSHRLGLSAARTPEKTADDLMALWPKALWTRAHHTLIFHGRQICAARRPNCPECPVLSLCPEGRARTFASHRGGRRTED